MVITDDSVLADRSLKVIGTSTQQVLNDLPLADPAQMMCQEGVVYC